MKKKAIRLIDCVTIHNFIITSIIILYHRGTRPRLHLTAPATSNYYSHYRTRLLFFDTNTNRTSTLLPATFLKIQPIPNHRLLDLHLPQTKTSRILAILHAPSPLPLTRRARTATTSTRLLPTTSICLKPASSELRSLRSTSVNLKLHTTHYTLHTTRDQDQDQSIRSVLDADQHSPNPNTRGSKLPPASEYHKRVGTCHRTISFPTPAFFCALHRTALLHLLRRPISSYIIYCRSRLPLPHCTALATTRIEIRADYYYYY
ncbi:hypothetical protein VTL71DRAFT_16238 [Oculimacula yallundae]|uniref:Uncharacterized protein n=1 Tax=Oculimacula yallundae TaxID=86028 RepID=A0ABR4CEH3_9HELO